MPERDFLNGDKTNGDVNNSRLATTQTCLGALLGSLLQPGQGGLGR